MIDALRAVSIQRNARNVRNATIATDATTASVLASRPLHQLHSLRALRWMETALKLHRPSCVYVVFLRLKLIYEERWV